METSKVAAENALHMSLDQYISEAGILDPNGLSVKRSNNHRNARFNRRNSDDEEQDDDDIEMCVRPNEYFDLDGDIPNVRSNQWRLMAPNTSADRPSGMPPLVSDKVQESLRTRTALSNQQLRQQISYADRMDEQATKTAPTTTGSANDMKIEFDNDGVPNNDGGPNNGGNRQRNRGGNNRWNHNNNRGNNNRNNGRWNNYTHNEGSSQRNNGHWNGNNGGGGLGGGVMRPNNQFKPDRLSVHNRIDHSYLDQRRQPQQLQICAPPTNSQPSHPIQTVALNSNTQVSAATLTAGVAASIANATDAMFVKHCIDAMPTVASKLLEQIDAMHRAKLEKKYDLKLQKEIAEVQGKQLLYTCPGTAVVSFDGPGIEVEPPQPHATETSMNQRFA